MKLAVIVFSVVCLRSTPALAGCAPDVVDFRWPDGKAHFSVEISHDPAERAKGLMFRRELPENAGMLFLYDQPQPAAMWMKNTIIPLDMIFIAAGGKVHRIVSHTVPHSTEAIASEGDVVAVLELNAGQADKMALRIGDKVVYPGLAE